MSATITRAVALLASVLAGAVLVTASAEGDGAGLPAGHGDQRALFKGPFFSSSATKDGEPYAFAGRSRLRLEFFRQDGKAAIRWRAGCNVFGMPVRISETNLDVRRGGSTEIGCPPALARQDRWLARFFLDDPAWRLHGNTLRLKAGDDRLRLRRKTAG